MALVLGLIAVLFALSPALAAYALYRLTNGGKS